MELLKKGDLIEGVYIEKDSRVDERNITNAREAICFSISTKITLICEPGFNEKKLKKLLEQLQCKGFFGMICYDSEPSIRQTTEGRLISCHTYIELSVNQ